MHYYSTSVYFITDIYGNWEPLNTGGERSSEYIISAAPFHDIATIFNSSVYFIILNLLCRNHIHSKNTIKYITIR